MTQPSAAISLPVFAWQPLLDTSNIRLIRLRGSSTRTAPLHLTLIQIPLSRTPKYYAISYAWQGQTPSQPILINKDRLLVTRNCEAALLRFRPIDPSSEIYVWIDAVCIDQSQAALEEKSQQVGMMGEIFGGAEQVWVWLGTRELDRLGEEFELVLRWFGKLDRAVSGALDFERVRKVKKLAVEVDLAALTRIHEVIPWFRRLWMVQEATLAKATVFFRDDLEFRYAPLIKACDIGLARGVGKSVEQVYYTFFVTIRLFYEVSQALPAITKGKPADLASFLFYAQIFRTSNPSDKIFALYGLLRKSLPDLPQPDYAKPVKDVYREATVALMRYSKDLKIMEMLHGGRVTPGIVSWVPDWACKSFPTLPMVGGDQTGQFHATKTSKSIYSVSESGLRLTIKGKIIDFVSHCAPLITCAVNEDLGPGSEYLVWTQNVLPKDAYWRGMLEKYPHSSPSILRLWNICVLQSFIRFASDTATRSSIETRIELYETLCSHSSNYSPKRIPQDLSAWGRWSDTLMRHDPMFADSSTSTISAKKSILSLAKTLITPSLAPYSSGGSQLSLLPSFLRENWNEDTMLLTPEFAVFEDIAKDETVAEIHAMLHNSLRYQTLFRTREGRLGMVCQGVGVGDRVLLVGGVSTPFIVREGVDGYTIVGPAFVRGVMEGEAWGRWGGKDGDRVGVEDVVLV